MGKNIFGTRYVKGTILWIMRAYGVDKSEAFDMLADFSKNKESRLWKKDVLDICKHFQKDFQFFTQRFIRFQRDERGRSGKKAGKYYNGADRRNRRRGPSGSPKYKG